MPTISEQLTQLQQDREDLVDNLETMGISGLSGDETFTELVPEVLNISGGGGGTITNTKLSEFNTMSETFVNYFNNYAETLPTTYNTLTSEATTLYTPNINYKYYAIQKRPNGKYRVDWFNTPRRADNTGIYPFATLNPSYQASGLLTSITKYSLNNANDTVYYSSDCDTPEICIQKMKNNELTYQTVNSSLGYAPDTPSKIPYTNIAIYYGSATSLDNDGFIIPIAKISSNETFVEIQ